MDSKPFLDILRALEPYARKLVSSFHLRMDYEDLMQEAALALVKFCDKHEKLKCGESHAVYRAFVRRALVRRAQTQIIKQRNDERIRSLIAEPEDPRSTGIDSGLGTILDVLAKAQRELGVNGQFALAAILEGSTSVEFAKKFKLSKHAGKKRYTRGMKILREVLERNWDCGLTRAVDAGDMFAP